MHRRSFLALATAGVLQGAKHDRYGEVLYESPHPGSAVFIIGHIHDVPTADDYLWQHILKSQQETYSILAENRGIDKLLVEGMWPQETAATFPVVPCDPQAYTLEMVREKKDSEECFNATMQFSREHNIPTAGWDNEHYHTLVGRIQDASQEYNALQTWARIQAGEQVPADIADKSHYKLYEYAHKMRSAYLLTNAMKESPVIATTGVLHLQHLIPWVRQGRITIDGVDSTLPFVDASPVDVRLDTSYHHFTLMRTHAHYDQGLKMK